MDRFFSELTRKCSHVLAVAMVAGGLVLAVPVDLVSAQEATPGSLS